MLTYIRKGWSLGSRQQFSLVALFVYQLLWSVILYRFINAIVTPLLRSYPGRELSAEALRVYWAEAQFQLMKTDIASRVLWTLAVMIGIRLLLSPFISAGVYSSMQSRDGGQGHSFVRGIRRLSRPFFFLELLRLAATLAPLFWLAPKAYPLLLEAEGWQAALLRALPWIAGYLLYCALLKLVFMYILFAKVDNRSFLLSLLTVIRHLVPIALISGLLCLIAGVAAAAAASASLIWAAGFLAMLVHLAYHAVRMLFKLWELGAQYTLWKAKTTQI